MKIFTNKKWNEYNDQFVDIQLENRDLKEDNGKYVEQVKTIVNINNDLTNTICGLEEKLKDAKKEIRRLKTLCTKNKINYKEEKKECKKK